MIELELYDTPEKISVRTFYKILENADIKLLAVNANLVKKEHEELLNNVWHDLLDFYYGFTNKQSWDNFLRNFKNVTKIQNEITGCKAAYELCLLGDDTGYEYLKSFGIKSNDLNAVKSAINAKETKLELAENKLNKKNEGESFRFYKMLVRVKNATKRELDVDKMCLAEWVETLNDISERNKAEIDAINKSKRR